MSDDNRYDAIIDRYINGQMAPAEEADFRRLVELDPELRRLFEADLRMVETMRREHEALEGVEHAESYSRFLMGLAASVPSTSEPEAAANGTGPRDDAERGGYRWLLGGLVLLLLAAVAFVVMHDEPSSPPPPTGDTTRARPSAIQPPATPTPAPSPSPTRRDAPSRPADTGRPARGGSADHPSSPIPSRVGPRDSTRSPEKTPTQARHAPERKREEIPTFEDDTLRARLKMERSDR